MKSEDLEHCLEDGEDDEDGVVEDDEEDDDGGVVEDGEEDDEDVGVEDEVDDYRGKMFYNVFVGLKILLLKWFEVVSRR